MRQERLFLILLDMHYDTISVHIFKYHAFISSCFCSILWTRVVFRLSFLAAAVTKNKVKTLSWIDV